MEHEDISHKEETANNSFNTDIDDTRSMQSISSNYNGILPPIIASSPISSASLSVSAVNVNGVTTGITGVSINDLKGLEVVEVELEESDGASDCIEEDDTLDDILEESEEDSDGESNVERGVVVGTVHSAFPVFQSLWQTLLDTGRLTMFCGMATLYLVVFLFSCVERVIAVVAREKGR